MQQLETIIAGGSVAAGDRVAPKIRCADGFTVSVQASWGHYSTDSNGKRPEWDDSPVALPYTTVEVGYPSARPEPWEQWREYAESPENPTGTVYGFVPVEMVRALVASHNETPRDTLSLPDRNHQSRELLSVLADVLNLADAMGVTVGHGAFNGMGQVQVHLDQPERAHELAAAIDGELTARHTYTGPERSFTTWTATHRGVPVIVFGTYAGPEVAS